MLPRNKNTTMEPLTHVTKSHLEEYPKTEDITDAPRDLFFPPRPHAQFRTVSLYEQDAFFAVQNGNHELLELLLGADELDVEAAEIQKLSEELIELKDQIHTKNSREIFLEKEIARMTELLKEGGIEASLRSQYQQGIDEEIASAKQFSQARSTYFVNGEATKANEDESSSYSEQLKSRLEADRNQYFSSAEMRRKIATQFESISVELKNAQNELSDAATEREALEEIKNDKTMQLEDIKDKRRQLRDRAVTQLFKALKNHPETFPIRYRSFQELGDNVKSILSRGYAARVDSTCIDSAGKSLVYYAIQKQDLRNIELLLQHGAILCLFTADPEGETPYKMAVKLGRNDMMQLISSHILPDGNIIHSGISAFHTPSTLRILKEEELALLTYAHATIDHYRKNVLPLRNSIWYRATATAQRHQIVSSLQDEVMPRALGAQSYYLWELAARQAMNDLQTGVFGLSYLRDSLTAIIEKATMRLAMRAHPWHLVDQIANLIENQARLRSENYILRMQSGYESAEIINAQKNRIRELEEERTSYHARVERLEMLVNSLVQSKSDEVPAPRTETGAPSRAACQETPVSALLNFSFGKNDASGDKTSQAEHLEAGSSSKPSNTP